MRSTLLVVWLLPACAAAAFCEINLSRSAGNAFLLSAGSKRWQAAPGSPQKLAPGDRIRTGSDSRATLEFGDGTVLALSPQSEIASAGSTLFVETLELRYGGARVRYPLGGRELALRTQAATIAPEVGDLEIRCDKSGRTHVRVISGSLLIRAVGGTWRAAGPQTEAVVSPGGSPSPAKGVERVSSEGDAPQAPASASDAKERAVFEKTASAQTSVDLSVEAYKGAGRRSPRPRSVAAAGSIPTLVDALEDSPTESAQQDLDDAVESMFATYAEEEGPPSESERQAILRHTYGMLAEEVENEAVHDIFMQGHEAFKSGQFLSAAERFALCRLLEPAQGWLREALEEYLSRQIPAAVEKTAGKMKGASAAGFYRSSYRSIARSDWEAAAADLRNFGTAFHWSARRKGPSREEADELALRAQARAELGQEPESWESRLMDLLRGGRDPERTVRALEDLLSRFGGQTREAWWQKGAEGLRRAYFVANLNRMIEEARETLSAGDTRNAMQILVGVLQRSPADPQALALLNEMQKQADSKRAREVRVVQVPVPAQVQQEGAKQHAAPEPQTQAPSVTDIVQAEAGYRRGLNFYLKGDYQGALEEWKQSLKLNGAHDHMRKAYQRVLKELGRPLPEEES